MQGLQGRLPVSLGVQYPRGEVGVDGRHRAEARRGVAAAAGGVAQAVGAADDAHADLVSPGRARGWKSERASLAHSQQGDDDLLRQRTEERACLGAQTSTSEHTAGRCRNRRCRSAAAAAGPCLFRVVGRADFYQGSTPLSNRCVQGLPSRTRCSAGRRVGRGGPAPCSYLCNPD